MKLISTLVLLFLPIFVFSQNYWSKVVDTEIFSSILDFQVYQDSMYLISGGVTTNFCGEKKLFLFDKEGELLWTVSNDNDRIFTVDEFIYTTGLSIDIDVVDTEVLTITKYNSQGEKLAEKMIPENFEDVPFKFETRSIDQYENGDLLFASDSSALISNANLENVIQLYYEKPLPVVSVNIIEGAHLISSESGIYLTDESFQFQDSIILTDKIIETIVKDDTIFVLFENQLLAFDFKLSLLDTIFDDLNNQAKSIFFDNEDLWVRTMKDEMIQLIKKSHNSENSNLLFPNIADVKYFSVSGENIKFFGDSKSPQISIQNYDNPIEINPDPELPDVELLGIEVENIELVYPPIEGAPASGYKFDVIATVKNNGQETINSLAGEIQLRSFFCTLMYYAKKSEINIPPGETREITFTGVQQYSVVPSENICMTLHAPNSSLETITNNNKSCRQILISSNQEEKIDNVLIYPNPTQNQIFIENLPAGKKEMSILDLSGKELKRIYSFGTETSIDLSDFQAGIYILRIFSEGQVINRKIVVQ